MSGGGRWRRKGRIQGWRLSRTAGWKSRGEWEGLMIRRKMLRRA
jgi:hypothetical protein